MYLQSHVIYQVIGHVRAGEWPGATTPTSNSHFTFSSFYRFNQLCNMFHNHAFHFYMFTFYLSITCHASMAYLYINLSVDLACSLASL